MQHKIKRRDVPFVLVNLVPGLILFAVTVIFPAVMALRYSLYESDTFIGKPKFVGLHNFAELFQDKHFWSDLSKTLIYAGGSVVFQVVLGIAIALLLNQRFAGRSFLRGATVLPYIVPSIVVTITWQWMLNTNYGVISKFLGYFGVYQFNFFSVDMSMITVVLVSVWSFTPFVTLVFLAGLQTVPEDMYESAALDGAGKWTQFRTITIPMLSPIIANIVLLRGIWMFNKFDLVWLMTGGGPLERTETLPVTTYIYTFSQYKIGYGVSIAVVSFLIMLIFMLIYLRLMNRANGGTRT
ncbi:carbohydrate ABC transporter permease [Cohnella caldifontis]|uniref:carbohydrate ABC transporter permease n=1 Tax=Cohnella caldifontis TaxID=3027471 RepID=UPI0023EA8410|nr:sugar ABC transporter permease [Cohnella sp. YIM B05605]